MTPMLKRAIFAAKELPEADQDALAAEILEWIEDERRWEESFARTHDALAELAREAMAEYDDDQDTGFADSDLDSHDQHGRVDPSYHERRSKGGR